MNKYLLDTNVVSELRKPRPQGGVVAWLNNQEEDQLFLSAVTMGELQAGIERTRRQDPSKASDIESWADQLAASYQILPMDTPCFREWGRIMDRKPDRLLEDAMIAATARVHQLIVATRNEADFRRLDVRFSTHSRRASFLPHGTDCVPEVCRMARNVERAMVGTRLTTDKPLVPWSRTTQNRRASGLQCANGVPDSG